MANQSVSPDQGGAPLNISFGNSRLARLAEIAERLLEKGPDGYFKSGMVYEPLANPPYKGVIHFGDPYADKLIIKSIPTRATEADIEAINKRIIWFPEAAQMYYTMALAFEARMPLVIEGASAIGKTWNMARFTEIIKGKGIKPEYFQCNGQTSTGDLFAKYVPDAGGNSEVLRKWENFLKTDFAKNALEQASTEIHSARGLDPDVKAHLLQAKVTELARAAGMASQSQWKLDLGAVVKAFIATVGEDGEITYNHQNGKGGEGNFLMVDEVGMAKSVIINALLQLRGNNRRVADSIRVWEANGTTFKAGSEFWYMMATNPPEGEGFHGRNSLDTALARGMIFLRMGDLSPTSYMMAAEKLVGFQVGNAPTHKPANCFLEYYKHPELTRTIGQVVAQFHLEYKEALKLGEEDREQTLIASLDHISATATEILSSQVVDFSSGKVDMVGTIKAAIGISYLDAHGPEFRDKMEKRLDSIFTSKVSAKSWRGQVTSIGKVIETLTEEASVAPKERAVLANRALKRSVGQLGSDVPDEVRKMLGDLTAGL